MFTKRTLKINREVMLQQCSKFKLVIDYLVDGSRCYSRSAAETL